MGFEGVGETIIVGVFVGVAEAWVVGVCVALTDCMLSLVTVGMICCVGISVFASGWGEVVPTPHPAAKISTNKNRL